MEGANIAEDVGFAELCVYTLVLAFILLIIFLVYYFYFRKYGLKVGKKHRCSYCGQLVEVISDCCRAPITERFLVGVCRNCGKECRMVCSRCKKRIMG